MKLYCVRIETSTYVMAENEKEAGAVISRKLESEIGDWDISAYLVDSILNVEDSWRKCIPFGEQDGDKTIAELLAA